MGEGGVHMAAAAIAGRLAEAGIGHDQQRQDRLPPHGRFPRRWGAVARFPAPRGRLLRPVPKRYTLRVRVASGADAAPWRFPDGLHAVPTRPGLHESGPRVHRRPRAAGRGGALPRASGARPRGRLGEVERLAPGRGAEGPGPRPKACGTCSCPTPTLGAGLTTLDYAPLAEEMGRSLIAPEVFNCSAPDTGNMEVLWRYGSDEQKERWLEPLLAGEIRSAFCMTEPDVASSRRHQHAGDGRRSRATSSSSNGRKWWSSGIGHPRCRGRDLHGPVADPDGRPPPPAHHGAGAARHAGRQRSSACCRCSATTTSRTATARCASRTCGCRGPTCIAGLGRGFEIAQGRLGPGRIHHCMRGHRRRRARARADDRPRPRAHRLRQAAHRPRRQPRARRRPAHRHRPGAPAHAVRGLEARHGRARSPRSTEISAIKVVAPNVLQRVVDEAIQIHGGAGPLRRRARSPRFFAAARALRLADGPDEVHRGLIARLELAQVPGLRSASR